MSALGGSSVGGCCGCLISREGLGPSAVSGVRAILRRILRVTISSSFVEGGPSSGILERLGGTRYFRSRGHETLAGPRRRLFLGFLGARPMCRR